MSEKELAISFYNLINANAKNLRRIAYLLEYDSDCKDPVIYGIYQALHEINNNIEEAMGQFRVDFHVS